MKGVVQDQFAKGSGQAPQYSTLAPVPANTTAKNLQSFDERAIMTEEAPTISGGPKGSPALDPKVYALGDPQRIVALDDSVNLRANGAVLTRTIPNSDKSGKDARPRIQTYRQQSGEDVR